MRTRASARSQAVFSRGVRCICTVDLSRAAAHAGEGTLRQLLRDARGILAGSGK